MSIVCEVCEDVGAAPVVALVEAAFGDAEGTEQGSVVGTLARNLLVNTPAADRLCYVAKLDAQVVGAIIFSRLSLETGMQASILAPVAVATAHQRQGIGQALIRYGLEEMRRAGCDLVITYGDPRYYAQTGFRPVAPERISPPLPLSQPHGWLGQSLTSIPLEEISGRCTCVPALDDAAYW